VLTYRAARWYQAAYVWRAAYLLTCTYLLYIPADVYTCPGCPCSEQRLALGLSRGLLNLQLGKMDVARKLVAALGEAYPKEQGVALLRAVLLARDNKVRGAAGCSHRGVQHLVRG
jgi:hypothetical protein